MKRNNDMSTISSLGFDKKKINKRSFEMRHGGNQLIEILENELSLQYIEDNLDELKIKREEYLILVSWLKSSANREETVKHLKDNYGISINTHKITTLFFSGGGLLRKLCSKINIAPSFDKSDKMIKRYSFLNYEDVIMMNGEYRLVEIEINQKKFWADMASQRDREFFNKIFVFKKEGSEWVISYDEVAKECISSFQVMKKLTN